MSRYLFLILAAIGMNVAVADAQTYPTRSITLVIPYPAGGSADIIGRVTAEKIGAALGQTVIVENKGGAATAIGASQVARAAPDGYTLLLSATPVSTNALLYKNLTYKASDFVPVAGIAKTVNVLSINASLPAKNFSEFLAYAKANPDKLAFASSGQGGLLHLITEKFMSLTGIKATHVPYPGAGPAWIDYIGGRTQFYYDSALASIPYAKDGKIRILAVGNDERIGSLPDVPTMKEVGYPMIAYAWYGIYAPAGTPKEIVARLNQEVNKAVASPDVKDRLAAAGGVGLSGSPEQFAEFVKNDYDYWEGIVKPLNIKLD